MTTALKDIILHALEGADPEGAVAYLRKQAHANPTAFLTLVGKVLPLQVAGASGQPATPRRVIIELDDAAAGTGAGGARWSRR